MTPSFKRQVEELLAKYEIQDDSIYYSGEADRSSIIKLAIGGRDHLMFLAQSEYMGEPYYVEFGPENVATVDAEGFRDFSHLDDAQQFVIDQLENWLLTRRKMAKEGHEMIRPREALDRYRDELRALVYANRCENPRVFGPAQRRDDTPNHKLLILVDAQPEADLFDLGGLHTALNDLVEWQVPVEARTINELPKRIQADVLRTAEPL